MWMVWPSVARMWIVFPRAQPPPITFWPEGIFQWPQSLPVASSWYSTLWPRKTTRRSSTTSSAKMSSLWSSTTHSGAKPWRCSERRYWMTCWSPDAKSTSSPWSLPEAPMVATRVALMLTCSNGQVSFFLQSKTFGGFVSRRTTGQHAFSLSQTAAMSAIVPFTSQGKGRGLLGSSPPPSCSMNTRKLSAMKNLPSMGQVTAWGEKYGLGRRKAKCSTSSVFTGSGTSMDIHSGHDCRSLKSLV
mmetsp:Transcript_30429/g.87242  ORF Transcript_30429/g.87242 Transcript_30429/m.87242 type:complete len:244 (-) Transcript_30429:1869-2600(-)